MPVDPRELLDGTGFSERAHAHGIAYFATLQSFLTYSFGWTRHDKGLLWWLDRGLRADDARFALIRDVWFADGLLEVTAAVAVRLFGADPGLVSLEPWNPTTTFLSRSPIVL